VVLNADTSIEVSCGENAAADKWVADKMLLWFGCKPAVKSVALSELPDGDEAYVLGAKDGKLYIRARTMQGVRWAAMTLRQLAQPERGTFKTRSYEVPEFTVTDRPETAFRALHLCAFPEVTPARLEHGIRMAAYYKFNFVVVEPWAVYRWRKHPDFCWPDASVGFLVRVVRSCEQ
jgi:hypothetical protein